jgi:hypothetical protein
MQNFQKSMFKHSNNKLKGSFRTTFISEKFSFKPILIMFLSDFNPGVKSGIK